MNKVDTLYFGLKLYELLTLIGVMLAPVIAVLVSLWIDGRRKAREQKTQTMRMLIGTRHLPSDPAYTAAINMIPVDFNKDRQVMAAWQAYIDCIRFNPHPGSQECHWEQVKAKQTKLIYRIMKSLGYELAETDIQTTAYAADGFVQRELMMIEAWRAWPRIAAALESQLSETETNEGVSG